MANPPTTAQAPIYYTPTQIGAAAVLAGWAVAELETIVAIALAESSGQVNAIGPLASGSRGYGLTQVMWPMHQELFPGGIQSGWWIDGTTNLKMARTIYQSQGWRAWETYTNGHYRLYAAQAATAAVSLQGAGANLGNAAQTVLQPTTGKVNAAQQQWAAANGGTPGPAAVNGVLTPAAAGEGPGRVGQGNPPIGEPAGAAPPNVSPIVRVLEVVLGSALLLLGLYKLTQPITTPIKAGIDAVNDKATKAVAMVAAPEAAPAIAASAKKAPAASAKKTAAPAKKTAAPAKKTAAPAKKAAAPKKKTAAAPAREEESS